MNKLLLLFVLMAFTCLWSQITFFGGNTVQTTGTSIGSEIKYVQGNERLLMYYTSGSTLRVYQCTVGGTSLLSNTISCTQTGTIQRALYFECNGYGFYAVVINWVRTVSGLTVTSPVLQIYDAQTLGLIDTCILATYNNRQDVNDPDWDDLYETLVSITYTLKNNFIINKPDNPEGCVELLIATNVASNYYSCNAYYTFDDEQRYSYFNIMTQIQLTYNSGTYGLTTPVQLSTGAHILANCYDGSAQMVVSDYSFTETSYQGEFGSIDCHHRMYHSNDNGIWSTLNDTYLSTYSFNDNIYSSYTLCSKNRSSASPGVMVFDYCVPTGDSVQTFCFKEYALDGTLMWTRETSDFNYWAVNSIVSSCLSCPEDANSVISINPQNHYEARSESSGDVLYSGTIPFAQPKNILRTHDGYPVYTVVNSTSCQVWHSSFGLPVVSNLKVCCQNDGSTALNWDYALGGCSFKIYSDTNARGSFSTLEGNTNEHSCVLQNQGTKKYYRVIACTE